MDDNARSHVSKKVKLWKYENVPLNIDHPPSPDINAIEFVWKYLKDYVENNNIKLERILNQQSKMV